MKKISLALALSCCLFALSGGLAAAQEEGPALCPQCAEMMFTADTGVCQGCGAQTSSGAFSRCPACARAQNACQACGAPLTGSGTATATAQPLPTTPETTVAPGTPAPSATPQPPAATLLVAGRVAEIVDRRPAEMYPNFFAVVEVIRTREGTLPEGATTIRVTGAEEDIALLAVGMEGDFSLVADAALGDLFILQGYTGNDGTLIPPLPAPEPERTLLPE